MKIEITEAYAMWSMGSCEVYWGSHGCSLGRLHDGDHTCLDLDDENPGEMIECCTVDRNGVDSSDFQWYLYGQHAPIVEGLDV